jgi:hypothetical protein
MRRVFLTMAAVAISTDAVAQGPSQSKLVCERGPVATKSFGGTPWQIFGCTSVQRDLFEAAIRVTAVGGRETLAAYLHQQHPRTIDSEHVARQAPEPDSLGG